MLVKILYFCALLGFSRSQGLTGESVPCSDDCPTITYQHYTAKGCEPVFNDSVSLCCPASFDCSKKLESKKCYYNGVAYNDGDKLPIDDPCQFDCFCSAKEGAWPSSVCPIVDCPSLFHPGVYADCEVTNRIDRCCEEITNCKGETAEIFTGTTTPSLRDTTVECNVEGKTYRQGQEIYPKSDPCQYCVCSQNFTDIYGPNCRTINCHMDHRDRQQLEEGCTPIYYTGRCCNFEWLCSDSDLIKKPVKSDSSSAHSAQPHCTLGEISLPLNSTLPTSQEELNCFCSTPPEFTCIKYPSGGEAKGAAAAHVRSP